MESGLLCCGKKWQQMKSCAHNLHSVMLGALWLKKKTITNQRLDKSTPHTLLVLESCQGALRRVSHSDSLIGVIHSVTSKTGEGGGRAGKLWHATAEFPLRSRDADRVTYFPHWAELQKYSCAAFIGREPSTCSVGLSPQTFEPPTLVNTQSL